MRRLTLTLIARHARREELPMLRMLIVAALVLLVVDVCARSCQAFRDEAGV